MPLPYLPSGASTLPEQRTIVFTDASNTVYAIDESLTTYDGVTSEGVWLSHCINREEPSYELTLQEVHLGYVAYEDTTLTVMFSSDGGSTYPVVRTVDINGGDDREHKVAVRAGITGIDLRMLLKFDTDILVVVTAWRPRLIKRGSVRYA